MWLGYLSFAIMLLFVLAYYAAFERCRYRTAKRLGEAMGGTPVFRPGRSYMRRTQATGEERAWIVPDDRMAWGSLLSAVRPPAGILFVQRERALAFRFQIEPKTGMLWGTISLDRLGDAPFHAPLLDKCLRLRTDAPPEAAGYFAAPEKQDALMGIFGAGFIHLKGDRKVLVATAKGVGEDDLRSENIEGYFTHLRSL